MRLVYKKDPAGVAFGSFDIDFNNDPKEEESLNDAVVLSLFTWSRARNGDPINGNTKYGWWANGQMGSQLWVTTRAKLTDGLLDTVKNTCKESLQWLIDDGVAKTIQVDAEIIGSQLRIKIVITKPDGLFERYQFEDLWKAEFNY